jgi:ABC transporter
MALMAKIILCRRNVPRILAIPVVCLVVCFGSAFSPRALKKKPVVHPLFASSTATTVLGTALPSSIYFAIHNVSLTLQQEIVLLQGASSSGKSALMKLIAGQETPTRGSVIYNNHGTIATPIWLADKPTPTHFDNHQHSVQHLLEKEAKQQLLILHKKKKSTIPQAPNLDSWIPIIVNTFCHLVHLDLNYPPGSQSLQPKKTLAPLSPSENYKIRLVLACLQSTLPGLAWNNHNNTNNNSNSTAVSVTLPAPILLLDEWLDTETRDTSSKLEQALLEVVQSTGAVIVCATHKPNLWKKLVVVTTTTEPSSKHYTTTQITMCRGAILTLVQGPRSATKAATTLK